MSNVVCKIIRNMGARAVIGAADKVIDEGMVPEEAAEIFYTRLIRLDTDFTTDYLEAFDWLGAARTAIDEGKPIPDPPWTRQ